MFAFHNSLGNVLRALGRAAEAEAAYRAALRLQPNVPDFHHHLGLALKDQGRAAEAEASFRQAIRLRRAFVPARIDLGNLLVAAARSVEAEACVRAALKISPDNLLAVNALGLALAAQGKHEAALACFEQVIAGAPHHANALVNRANSLAILERHEDAVAAYQAALAAAPEASDVRLGLARGLLALERGAEAEDILRAAQAARPDDAQVLALLGRALAFQDRIEGALEVFREAARLEPSAADTWEGIGLALRDLGSWPEALAPFAEAARLAPEDAGIRANYGYALMANGAFAEAWPHFEYRVRKPGNARLREPAWDGTQTDRVVLIHAEQGLGDTLQFVRFVPEAARRARIVLGCPASLNSLLHCLPGVAAIVSGEPVPRFDLHCPLMSLPMLFGVQPEQFYALVPYIHADAAKVAVWRDRLAGLGAPRVGLVWAGNPKYPADRRRSLPPAHLAPLLAVPGISWVSLQMADVREGLPDWVFDAAPLLADFTDTAACVAALDLVISVDTSVAHLAGAMGKPVWLLNRADTDWRWLLDRADSPWYPTMRIFRQPSPGDWRRVIEDVAAALSTWSWGRV
jgi:tetratricopeptide (TPR) repeat protein